VILALADNILKVLGKIVFCVTLFATRNTIKEKGDMGY